MHRRRILTLGLGLLAAAAMSASGPVPSGFSRQSPSPPPQARVTLMWSQVDPGSGTWPWMSQRAADWTEGGYTDWRLPTLAEAQAAVQAGIYGPPGTNLRYWTSKHQGNWDYWVDRNGGSGREFWNAIIDAKFVRP